MCLAFGSLWAAAIAYRQEPPLIQERVNSFLTDVVGFNLTEHKIVQRNYNPFSRIILTYQSAILWGEPFSQVGVKENSMEQVTCTLQASDGEIPLLFYFAAETHTLSHYSQQANFLQGSPAINVPDKGKILSWIKGFLGKYETYSNNASHISAIQKAFDSVSTLEPLNMTIGDVQLRISAYDFTGILGGFLSVSMTHTHEGVQDESKALTMVFRNGSLTSFTDTWTLN